MSGNGNCECKHESKIAMLEQRDQMILDLLQKLEGKVDLVLMQLTKVAVLEANHDHQSEALGRAFTRIESLELEMKSLSKSTNEFISHTKGMARMAWYLWGLITALVGALGIKVMF